MPIAGAWRGLGEGLMAGWSVGSGEGGYRRLEQDRLDWPTRPHCSLPLLA